MKKMNNPLISVVILLGENREKDCKRCIESIMQSTFHSYEILIVNNSGKTSFVEQLVKRFPEVRIIEMPYNTGILGFNIGYANAHGEYILSLDDDAAVRKDTLQQIAQYFHNNHNDVGIVGVNSMNPESGVTFHEHFINQSISRIFSATAGGYVVQKKALLKSGYYDDRFFMWIHEDDLFLRMRDSGYDICFAPDIKIYHYDSWHKTRPLMVYLMFRNSIWMFIKNFSWYFIPILTARIMITLLLMPMKKRSVTIGFVGLAGIVMGFSQSLIPLHKRMPVKFDVQWLYIKYYLLNQFPE